MPREFIKPAASGKRARDRWNRKKYGISGERGRGPKDESCQMRTACRHGSESIMSPQRDASGVWVHNLGT